MATFLVIIFILLGITSVVGLVVFVHSRKVLREQKNFERGLKMVPLLIHLPPPSDDTENTGRDVREMVDENISKAQILYNIIASTLQKGFKSRFYGQRHFGFEIVGAKGFVHFYAAVPIALVEVVKQAVVSAYPAARLEEVAEHNIFSPVGKISGTIGGELTLKEHYAYPIATFQDLKRDAMQSLLNSLSTLDKEDGVGIQILMRPADSGWRKAAQKVASEKRKGKEKNKGVDLIGAWSKDLAKAFIKAPEEKSSSDKPELSGLDQSVLDAIDDKTRHPGYEVLIRVVASSNVAQRAQAILGNVTATFALFDAQGKNGFKYSPAKDIDSFVTAYILRFFPQEHTQTVLNSVELATIFHFPDQKNIPTSQLQRQESKQVDGPRNVMDDGLLLGYNVFRGAKKPIRLTDDDRRRHVYTVGQTGVGKSVFLENLALQDMLAGRGFAFVDPHGDTAETLLSMVPRERTEDVIYFCPADMDYPMGLNLFEFNTPGQKDFLIQEVINMIYKLYDPQRQGIVGPRFEVMFRNAALTIMADPEGGSFVDVPKLFTDPGYLKQKLKHVTDPRVLDYWNKEVPMSQRSNDFGEVVAWMSSKFGAFLSNEMMRNIIGQTKSSFDLREIMDNKKILLVNLSKGRTGELNSKLLGMIFVMKFQAAAMSRADIAEEDREDFCLYVDEFQNFSTDSFATILSEARKYRLNLIVANQFTTQLTEEVRDAVFGNVGTIISFRVGSDADADTISRRFEPIFDRQDVLRVPNFNTIARMIIKGVPTQPFSMAMLPPLGTPNKQLLDALKQLSAAKYGRLKSKVEKEIFERLATEEPPKPAFGNSPFGPSAAAGAKYPSAPGKMPGPAPGGGSSFLDEWLAKRRGAPAGAKLPSASASQPPANPFTPPAMPAPPPSPFAAAPNPPVPPVPDLPDLNPFSPPAEPSAQTPAIPAVQSVQQEQAAIDKTIDEELQQILEPTAVKEPEPELEPETEPVKKDTGEVHLSTAHGRADTTGHEDTIFIDRDGNIKNT